MEHQLWFLWRTDCYALQSANISRIFSTLGADPHSLSYFWILPPLAGIVVQPVSGGWVLKAFTTNGDIPPEMDMLVLAGILLIIGAGCVTFIKEKDKSACRRRL